MTSFSIFRQHWKNQENFLSNVLNTFENITENGTFAPMESNGANAPLSLIF